jgi:uncharacterized protein YneF (UPF0154 family)
MSLALGCTLTGIWVGMLIGYFVNKQMLKK